jgi:hypothetical protein
MVSVWSKFDVGTSFYAQLQQQQQLLPNSNYMDVWNSGARTTFYGFCNQSMFSLGVGKRTKPEQRGWGGPRLPWYCGA